MVRSHSILLLALMMTLSVGLILGCELEQAWNGCKIAGGTCTCGFGCKSEYRYPTNQKCRNALKERGTNICNRFPCLNRGSCIQITQEPGYKCKCENTGFYGNRCERVCPTTSFRGGYFPYECVVI